MSSLTDQVTSLTLRAHDDEIVGRQDIPGLETTHIVSDLCSELIDRAMETIHENLGVPKAMAKPRICHQCHAPLDDPVHVGVSCGVGRCTLQHWEGCEGGIDGGKDGRGKSWAACVEGTDDSDSDNDSEKTEFNSELRSSNNLPATITEAATLLNTALGANDDSVYIEDSSSDDEELREQRLEFERLKNQIESETASAKVARSEERKKKRAHEKKELAQQMKILKEKQKGLPTPTSTNSNTGSATGTRTKDLKDKVAEHEAKKQRKAAAKKSDLLMRQPGTNMTMSGIRALPGVREEVEGYITQLKAMIPTLSSDPTASGYSAATFQPESVHAVVDRTPASKYVYVSELGRTVPVVNSVSDLPSNYVIDSDSDSECSSDENCPFKPEPGVRFAWKKHNDGRKFFKKVPVKEQPSKMVVSYQLNEATGTYEQVLVPELQHG